MPTAPSRLRNGLPALCVFLVLGVGPAGAGIADSERCGKPVATGPAPGAADALAILRCAVGLPGPCDAKPCFCDVDSSGSCTVQDALLVLRSAVGAASCLLPEGCLSCSCPDLSLACTSARLEILAGSKLDLGWTGIAHGLDAGAGLAIDIDVARRCAGDASPCHLDTDCAAGPCLATCDCGTDPTCELEGPSHGKRCATTLVPCDDDGDCPVGVSCVHPFGPPQPLSAGGTPLCVVSLFTAPLSGTFDAATGALFLAAELRMRVHLGIALSQPCPRCGPPFADPQPGDVFTCEGSQRHGQPCTVHGATPLFGGTSFDCPPTPASSTMGNGLAIRLPQWTTATTVRTAALPCAGLGVRGNPLSPGSSPKCLDDPGGPVCSGNADCRRCQGDATVSCLDDSDCGADGPCAEAPGQPVSCGYWCHCGFCDGDETRPCFGDDECPVGKSCVAGPGVGSAQNRPQHRPNDCLFDSFVCGTQEEGRCDNTLLGYCRNEPWRACLDDDGCPLGNHGDCILDGRPCFGSRLVRQGAASVPGSYCAIGDAPCTFDGDCPAEGDRCVSWAARPRLVAPFCSGATLASTVSTVFGLTGPGVFSHRALLKLCSCGDSVVGCAEQCDDGNAVGGDGCSASCRIEAD